MKNIKIFALISTAFVGTLIALIVVIIPRQVHLSNADDYDMKAIRLHCPDQRSTPIQVPGINNAKSVAFQGGYLVALDSQGHLWSYFVEHAASCETYALALDPTRKVVNGGVSPAGMAQIASSAEGGVGLTIDGTLVTWEPSDAHPICAAGLTGGDCGVFVKRSFTGIHDIAQSASHLLIVTKDGRVLSAGMNDCGQLGRTEDHSPPLASFVAPVPGLTGMVAVAAGKRSSMALGRDGKVWTWGNLSHPLVGSSIPPDPTLNTRYCGPFQNPFGLSETADTTPAIMPRLPPVTAISSFHGFDLALDRNGHVWGWGYNDCGQIGGDPVALVKTGGFQASPAMIEGLPKIQAIAAGRRHALFLGIDGSVWATGDNEFEQLAMLGGSPPNGRTCVSSTRRAGLDAYSEKPHRIEGIGNAIAIAADGGHSAAVDVDGHVWLWGRYP
ncbi:hypothetical protein [Xanthomonas sp. NCPPB 2632]|uniref:hypothetical protein n=1 Tax=Xanthomonas sp. NCPPB 2632 TaxID=3240912 RepID=UPI003516EB2D